MGGGRTGAARSVPVGHDKDEDDEYGEDESQCIQIEMRACPNAFKSQCIQIEMHFYPNACLLALALSPFDAILTV